MGRPGLSDILAEKRRFIEELRRSPPPETSAGRRGEAFLAALSGPDGIRLIAELKRSSPSAGRIRETFDPAQLAGQLAGAGASALSVLADAPFFGGSPEHVRVAAETTGLPVLMKDFFLDPLQVRLAASLRASAILLIVRCLSDEELRGLRDEACRLGLATLVEAHDEGDLERALAIAPAAIGVNNRDLERFEVHRGTAEKLRGRIPEGIVTVAESGYASRDDVVRAREAGFDAVLVGGSVMGAGSPAAKVRELLGRGA